MTNQPIDAAGSIRWICEDDRLIEIEQKMAVGKEWKENHEKTNHFRRTLPTEPRSRITFRQIDATIDVDHHNDPDEDVPEKVREKKDHFTSAWEDFLDHDALLKNVRQKIMVVHVDQQNAHVDDTQKTEVDVHW